MHSIESRIHTVVGKVLQLPPDAFPSDTSRNSLPQWDSIAHLNLMLALEDEFGVEFSDQEIASLDSLDLLLNALEAKCR